MFIHQDIEGGCPLIEKENGYNSSKNSGLGTVLFQCMKKHHNEILQYLADSDEADTYGEVLKRSVRAALKLKEKGVNKDDILSSCTHNHKNSIIPFLAALFIGAKNANFDPNLSYLDTVHLLKLIKPKIIFVAVESLSFIEKCLRESKVSTELVVFGDSGKYSSFSEYLERHSEENTFQPEVIKNARETAIIMFSSGTTGLPKGICLSHYGLLGNNLNNGDIWSNNKKSVILLYTTLYWISSVVVLLRTMTDGGARVVCSKFDPINTWRLIEKYKITGMFLAPYLARDFLTARQKDVDIGSLDLFITGSTPVTVELMNDLREALPNVKVVNGYGQTEATGMISVFSSYNANDIELQKRKPLSCGRVLEGYTWKVVDPTTEKILGTNERGEFRYKNDYQMSGYYKIDSSSAYDSEGFIKTGDIVYYDEEDCLYIMGRIKESFKYKGWHILPSVLEGVLLTHPAVKEAVVIGVPHEIDGDHPMGLVVLNKGRGDVTEKDIEQYVEERVPDIQRLRAGVKFVDSMLRTTTGKIKRVEMTKMAVHGFL